MIEQVDKILKKIETLRKSKGLTHGNMLSEVTVESASAYSKIEKNTNISVLRLLEISKALEVDAKTWFENLDSDNYIIKEDKEKYGKPTSKDMNDIYLLVHDLKREIALLKKEIATINPDTATKKRGSKK